MWIRIDIWGIGHYGVYWYLFFMCRGWLRNEVGCWTVGGLDMGWWFCGLMDDGWTADMFGPGSRRNMDHFIQCWKLCHSCAALCVLTHMRLAGQSP